MQRRFDKVAGSMARIGKYLLVFGVGLSALALAAMIGTIERTYFSHLSLVRSNRPPSLLLGALYLMGVVMLAQSKSSAARISIFIAAVVGYVFVFAFFGWIWWAASN